MTIQMNDHVRYKGKRYVLVDTELSLIDSADFEVAQPNGYWTACWRGYLAEYEVTDNVLYGVKTVKTLNREKNTIDDLSSKCLRMNYTGSILIGRTDDETDFIADYFDSYLDTDEAYELHFVNGVLDKEISLKAALDEWERIVTQLKKEIDEKINKGMYKDKYEGWTDIDAKQRDFAKENLKYSYCNYKWGTRNCKSD